MDERKERQAEVEKFVEQLRADDALKIQIGEAGDLDTTVRGIVQKAREEGYDFSEKEVRDVVEGSM